MEHFPAIFLATLANWWIIIPAIFIGLIAGAVPGFGAVNTIIILLPLTLTTDVQTGLTFMIAIYCSSRMGAGIPAILVNIPGTAGASATPLDGYPMAKAGKAQQALTISFTSSTLGGFIVTAVALFVMPYLAQVAYHLHSTEMIVIMLFGISMIASVASKNPIKGLAAGFLGIMIGSIGADFIYETPRGTMGFLELYEGVPLVPALVGLFAITEAFLFIEQSTIAKDTTTGRKAFDSWSETWKGIYVTVSKLWHVTWTSLIGLVVGIVPGAGATIAAFVAYQQSRLFSKTPEAYGTGHPEGLIAPESANNGVTAGTLIPLLTLGIPGGATAAIMAVVMQYHGVTLGPRLFQQMPELGYGLIMAMLVTYMLMMVTILPLSRYISWVTKVPTDIIAPIVIAFTLVGSFVTRGYIFDMYLALAFGVLGYIAKKTGYHVVAILIGVVLGPLLEQYFLRAMRISEGDLTVLFSSGLGNVLWVALLFTIVFPYFKAWRRKKDERLETAEGDAGDLASDDPRLKSEALDK